QVEVRIDGGQWTKATLAAPDSIDTWLQWYVPWQATAGQHTLEVRATDKTGYTQTPPTRGVFPAARTGHHTVHVSVAWPTDRPGRGLVRLLGTASAMCPARRIVSPG